MSLVTVTLDINGEQVTAEDASWYLVAPCGCTRGACVVAMPYGGEHVLTEDAAFTELYGNAELRRRDVAAGYKAVLGKRSEAVERLTSECPHDPHYGVPAVPIPDGYAWAERYGSNRVHLVPADYVDALRVEGGRRDPVASLCFTGEPTPGDKHFWRKPYERVTCRRCEKVAVKLAGGAA